MKQNWQEIMTMIVTVLGALGTKEAVTKYIEGRQNQKKAGQDWQVEERKSDRERIRELETRIDEQDEECQKRLDIQQAQIIDLIRENARLQSRLDVMEKRQNGMTDTEDAGR